MKPLDFHLESRPCHKCGATMLYDEGEPWDGPTWACTGCGHSENAMKHTEAQCRADAARESEAGDPDQSVGPPAPKLTAEQVCNIGFAVLRAHNDDRLWRALTYDSGPYDLTTPNLALQELGAAFYAAGYVEAPKTTTKVKISSDPDLLRRTMAAEVEVVMLRAAIDQKHAEYEDLKACAANNARNLNLEGERAREHLRLAVDHIAALNGALEDLASLGATIAICGTKYDDAAARKALES